MRKLILAAGAIAALAVPSAALANPHESTDWQWNTGSDAYIEWTTGQDVFDGSLVGQYTSQITHNGWAVQTQKGEKGRSDVVQGVHLLDGQGRLAK